MNKHSYDLARRAGIGMLALAMGMALTACGGGGGNPGATIGTGSGGSGTGGTTTPAAPTMTLAFVNGSGQSTNALSSASQLTVKATVKDKEGKVVPNALVSFATDPNLAVFSPTSGTALTDANGVASITMRAASLASGGAGSVTVTSTVAGTTVTSSGNYSVGATSLTFGPLIASPASIQAYGSTVLSVDLLAGGAKYTAQQVNVNFSSACVTAGKATLASVVPTNNGTAQTVYRDQGCGNNDVITVTATGVDKPATQNLSIAVPAPASVQFVEAAPTDKSIVIQGQGGSGRTETATLKFRVFDIFNRPLAGRQVNFSASTNTVKVNKSTDTTDQNGEVITTVNSGTVATTFRVLATLPGTASGGNPDISTWSDSVVVTTGQPVQRAFSLVADNYNLDSSIESSPSSPAAHVSIMIGDNSGNPVPDGTPVVFQTNMGSIGSSSKGGCTTVNGGCTVDFRMQDPRSVATPNLPATPCNQLGSADVTRPGVATVCASSTDGTNTIFKRIALFFSGSVPATVIMDGTTQINPKAVTDLGSIPADGAKVFTLQFNDVNGNPLPSGTAVAVADPAFAASSGAFPPKVPVVYPHNASTGVEDISGSNIAGLQGSTHTFTIKGTQPTGCTKALDATFNVTTTTPALGATLGGIMTVIPFKLRITCP